MRYGIQGPWRSEVAEACSPLTYDQCPLQASEEERKHIKVLKS